MLQQFDMLFQVEIHARLADEIILPLIHKLIICHFGNADLMISYI